MNGIEKIDLLEKIGSELQSRMTFSDIDVYFQGHGVPTSTTYPQNSKRTYSKDMLSTVKDELLLRIADELEIDHSFGRSQTLKEVTFWKAGYFKLFLSHLAGFKSQTSHLQNVLKKYAISSFVAHEDIEPTKEWQQEIEAGLHTMDALAAILMPGFKESNWCDQEVGVAVGRDVLVIPIRKGLDPYGFIGKYQGIQAQGKTIGEVSEAIFNVLIKSPKTKTKMLVAILGAIPNSSSIEEALEKVSIVNTIDSISSELLENLRIQVSENSLLMDSEEFINKVNSFLVKHNSAKIGVTEIKFENEWDDLPF